MTQPDLIELSMVKQCQQCGADTDAAYRTKPTRAQSKRYAAVLRCVRCNAIVGFVFSAAEIELRHARLAVHDAMEAQLRDISETLRTTSTNRRARWE